MLREVYVVLIVVDAFLLGKCLFILWEYLCIRVIIIYFLNGKDILYELLYVRLLVVWVLATSLKIRQLYRLAALQNNMV